MIMKITVAKSAVKYMTVVCECQIVANIALHLYPIKFLTNPDFHK